MSKFSKKDDVSKYFENMKNEVEEARKNSNKTLSDFTKDDEFKTGTFKIDFSNGSDTSTPLQKIKNKVEKNSETQDEITETVPPKKADEESIESLLDKCRAFTKDDDGNDFSVDNSPIYELESVAEILKSDSIGALESLSKKYNIVVKDETTHKKPTEEKPIISKNEILPSKTAEDKKEITSIFKKLVDEANSAEKSDDKIFEDYFLDNNPQTEIDDLQKKVPDISDIDSNQKISSGNTNLKAPATTIKFTPIRDAKNKSKISISSITATIDLNKKLNFPIKNSPEVQSGETKLENSDFEDFVSKNQVNDISEGKKYLIKLAKSKRIKFLQIVSSFLLFIAFLFNFITPIYDKFTTEPKSAILYCLILLVCEIFINIDMFFSFGNLFSKNLNADIAAATASTSALLLTILQYFDGTNKYSLDTFYLLFLILVILTVRSITSFWSVSSKMSNLSVLLSKREKNAITFIGDTSVTFAMANNSIDGDVLIAAPKKTSFVKDFTKYYDYQSILGNTFGRLQIIYIILAVILGIIGKIYYGSLVSALFTSTSVLSIFAIPCLFFINTLPLHSASKKLNKSGAMLAGTEGAEQLEFANAAVISSSEIFPSGTIILKDLKILSNNNIDDTILKATSLTEAVGSPLSPIFKQIAKTNSKYVLPDSDTVKYEEKWGLSGWVDNELLFIGNRTLLESHGIEVPSLEVDKRILHEGYFPVYLATSQKAVALIIVDYRPSESIARELRKITNLGVTLLIKNCDPNISEGMLSDYFGLYEDTLKIISNAGINMFEKTVVDEDSCSAPALFTRKNLAMVKILNAATRIKKSNSFITFIYTVSFILLTVGFVYLGFSQPNSLPSSLTLLTSEIAITVFSAIIYLFKKP